MARERDLVESPGAASRRPSRALLGLVVSAGAILFSMLAAELTLRLVGYRTPVLLPDSIRAQYRIEPGARFTYRGYLPGNVEDFANEVVLNRLGFHDRDYPPERPNEKTYRIMVLGDSYVAAWEVPLEATFHKLVEARLAREDPLGRGSYQVIAIGQGRSAQEREIEWMRQYAPIYHPDLVLYVFFCGNDFMENDPAIFQRASEFGTRYIHEIVPRKMRFFDRLMWLPRLRLNGLLAEAATDYYVEHLDRFDPAITHADLESPELGIYENPLPPEWQAALDRTGKLLDVAMRETHQLGARFAVASLSGPQAIGDFSDRQTWAASSDSRFDFGRGDRWIHDWAERRHVDHLELGPPLVAIGRRKVFWKHDQHLNASGHAAVASLLYPFLVDVAKR